MVGDILHEDLSIETGGFLEGHCKRMAMPEDVHISEKPNMLTDANRPKPTSLVKPAPAHVK